MSQSIRLVWQSRGIRCTLPDTSLEGVRRYLKEDIRHPGWLLDINNVTEDDITRLQTGEVVVWYRVFRYEWVKEPA